jgi:SAM-dependent methyltransferase
MTALASRALASPFGRLAQRVLPASLRRRLGATIAPVPNEVQARLAAYEDAGRIPWSVGYADYKHGVLKRALRDADLLARFAGEGPLPTGWGVRLDERLVEYPWLFARAARFGARVLDAGSTLNEPLFLEQPALAEKDVLVYDLDHKYMARRPRVSYVWGDLRDTMLRDGAFDTVVCLSTLEHVGLDNTRLYTSDPRFRESALDGWKPVLAEFQRLLKAGGRAFVSVPFGVPENLGWMQVFDAEGLARLQAAWAGPAEIAFFRYDAQGWQRADAAACADRRYFDVHSGTGAGPDGAAAARAVACLELTRA